MVHIYAVIPKGEKVVFDVAGIDSSHDEVYSVPHGDISAVVSASPPVDYCRLRRDEAIHYLVAHQRVVEEVMRFFPVLPVKFGTTLPGTTGVYHFLAQGEELLRNAMDKFAGLIQMEVVALWKLSEVLKEIAREKSIVQLKAKVLAQGSESSMDDRIAIGRMVQESLERRRFILREKLITPLRKAARDLVVNPIMNDDMVANLAFLVDKVGQDILEQHLEALDKEFEGRLHLRCVGPLPPYSFASVEVKSPSFDAINEACRNLGLGEKATLDEIKQAYRQLAGQWHPDHNPDKPEAESRMAELTRSYDLLTLYAANLTPNNGNTQCRFDRKTVKKALLIAIRRYDTAMDEGPSYS